MDNQETRLDKAGLRTLWTLIVGYINSRIKSLKSTLIPNNTDLNSLLTEGVYVGNGADTSGYLNCPFANDITFTLEVMSAGGVGQLMQRITTCNGNPSVWIRHYYPYNSSWGNWTCITYDTTWNSLNGGFCQYRAKNGMCTVKGNGWGDYTIPKGVYTVIGTIPEGYRPSIGQYFTGLPLGGTACVFGRIEPDGKVYLYTDADNITYWLYSFTYPI